MLLSISCRLRLSRQSVPASSTARAASCVRNSSVCQFDLAHAAGGIDPRGERIADGPRRDGSFLHRRIPAIRAAMPTRRGFSSAFKPSCDHRAVLARQGHHVRNRAEAEEITVLIQERFLLALRWRQASLNATPTPAIP